MSKSLKNIIYEKFYNYTVSIITCTNKQYHMNNIFENYNRQNFKYKQLIIILNNNSLDIKEWQDVSKKYENVSIYALDENDSLGNCLNFAVDKAKFNFIAKFDDDDYYGPNYLTQAINTFKNTDASIVGKGAYYVYFKPSNTLGITRPDKENSYAIFVAGPSMVIKKSIFDSIKFRNISIGEDKYLLKDCLDNGLKVYSTDTKNFAYTRYDNGDMHTWKISNKDFMKHCDIIGIVSDISQYVDK